MKTTTCESSTVAWLATQLRTLLHLSDLPGPDASPLALGLTSLAAVTLQYHLSREQGLALTLDELMSASSLVELARQAHGRVQA